MSAYDQWNPWYFGGASKKIAHYFKPLKSAKIATKKHRRGGRAEGVAAFEKWRGSARVNSNVPSPRAHSAFPPPPFSAPPCRPLPPPPTRSIPHPPPSTYTPLPLRPAPPGSISSSTSMALPMPPGPCCAEARFSMRSFLALMNSNRFCHSVRWMFLHRGGGGGGGQGGGGGLLKVSMAGQPLPKVKLPRGRRRPPHVRLDPCNFISLHPPPTAAAVSPHLSRMPSTGTPGHSPAPQYPYTDTHSPIHCMHMNRHARAPPSPRHCPHLNWCSWSFFSRTTRSKVRTLLLSTPPPWRANSTLSTSSKASRSGGL